MLLLLSKKINPLLISHPPLQLLFHFSASHFSKTPWKGCLYSVSRKRLSSCSLLSVLPSGRAPPLLQVLWTGSPVASLARPNGLFLVFISTCLSTRGDVVNHSLLRLPFLKITLSSFLIGCPFCLLCWFFLLFLSWGTQSSVLRPLVYVGDLIRSCDFQALLTPTSISPAQTSPFDSRRIHPTAPLTFPLDHPLGISDLTYLTCLEANWCPHTSVQTCSAWFLLH